MVDPVGETADWRGRSKLQLNRKSSRKQEVRSQSKSLKRIMFTDENLEVRIQVSEEASVLCEDASASGATIDPVRSGAGSVKH